MGDVTLILILIIAANGAPIVARVLFGTRLRAPLDGGRLFRDGRPLFGASKTWLGLLAALLTSGVLGALLGLSFRLGVAIGAAAMAGDLLSSFVKRRLGRPPSSQALGLDQIPESLLPALLAAPALQLSALEILVTVALFLVLELMLSRLLYRVGLRQRPY